jgi:hypothetical protein
LGGGQGEDFFFSFFLCSLQVPNGFPMCSPRVFPIAPRFSPVCFAHSLGGPKGGRHSSFP